MCEALGSEPLEEEIPISREDLREETQLIFYLYDKLPERWEGFSGTYLGKELSLLPVLYNEFDYEPCLRKYGWELIPIIDKFVAQEVSQKIKAASKSKGDMPSGITN